MAPGVVPRFICSGCRRELYAVLSQLPLPRRNDVTAPAALQGQGVRPANLRCLDGRLAMVSTEDLGKVAQERRPDPVSIIFEGNHFGGAHKTMLSSRRLLNLFYYNLFRFDCFIGYLIAYPMLKFVDLVGLKDYIESRGRAKKATYNFDKFILSLDNDPRGGISLVSAGMHVMLLVMLVVFTLLNILAGTWKLGITFWSYGAAILGFVGLLISNFFLAPTARNMYLKDFHEFEKRPREQKRKDALMTFCLVIMIWILCISSFWFYFRSFRR